MRLGRLWANGPLGFRPEDAGLTGAAVRFADRARRHAIRLTRQIAAAGAVLVICLWLSIVWFLQSERQAALDQAQAHGRNLAAAVAEAVSQTLTGMDGAMNLMIAQMLADPGDGGNRLNIARWATLLPVLARPAFYGSIIGPDGHLLSTTLQPAPPRLDFSDQDDYRAHLDTTDTAMMIGKPVMSRLTDQTVIQISRRISSGSGQFLGVLALAVLPGDLTLLHHSIDFGTNGVLTLVGTDGTIRARFGPHSPDSKTGAGVSIKQSQWPWPLDAAASGSFIRPSSVDHIVRLCTYRQVPDYPLIVVVGQDREDVLAPSRARARIIAGLGGGGSALLGLLTLLLVREIWRRTQREVELVSERDRLEAAQRQINEDRTKLQAANKEMLGSKERAEAANQAKSRFLAHMSHELRTPLNAIIGFSELIKDQAPRLRSAPAIVDYATDIWSSGRHLLELINTILDISKIDSGTERLVESTVSIEEIIQSSLVAVRGQAETRQIRLDTRLPFDLPLVRVDATRMRQVLINLLSNAVKFTADDGRVTITGRHVPGGNLVVTVRDTGIGMTEAEIAVALEPFGQVQSSFSRSFEGTGLGLPLARRLVELHGGQLQLTSVRGEGTTVEVLIPSERVVWTELRSARA